MSKTISGVCPVLAVPFTPNGEVDFSSFKSLVKWIISLGTKSVLFFGVASENIKLNDVERYKLLETLIESRLSAELKVITSVADHSAELAVKRARDYAAIGADFINILPPSYFNPSQEQLKLHISKVMEAVNLPVIVQHLPQGGGAIEIKELIELRKDHPNFKMIKCEANPPTDSINEISKLTNGEIKTLVGWGGISWADGVAAGAVGVQPGCSLTDLYLWAEQSLNSGNINEFKGKLTTFIPYISNWIGNLENLIAIEKRILQIRGIIESDYCRHPTVKISEESEREIAALLHDNRDLTSR